MKDIMVIKLGGSVLQDSKALERAASWVKDLSKEHGLVVVVSALKGMTDELLRTAKEVNPDIRPDMLDEVLAMGERTSARLFTAALNRFGVDAVLVDPSNEYWPVITDDVHLDANPIYHETEKRCKEKLLPLIEAGKVPVVCGYIGVSTSGKITTLGRGGSDTTAILLGSCLNATEVVLIKDVEGIYSGDPDKVSKAEILDTLNVDEVRLLTEGGAKVIHSKALRYLSEGLKLRVSSMEGLGKSGTVIIGTLPKLEVSVHPAKVTMITILSRNSDGASMVKLVIEFVQRHKGEVLNITTGEKSIIVYTNLDAKFIDELHREVVESGTGKAISFFEGLSAISISGRMLETSPGVIHKVVAPLALNGINIYGLVTISSSIRVFVSAKDVEKVASLIKANLEVELNETN
ncbi:MAG: aspartate kinase [Nitrososphaerota archaeon]|nr:aspartate kinase [Aigarchaeota archaeon]MDW8076619.1 aspartate kinase [Nitrososphaerota archaeon]